MRSQALHYTPTEADYYLGPTLSWVLTLCNSTYGYMGPPNISKVISNRLLVPWTRNLIFGVLL